MSSPNDVGDAAEAGDEGRPPGPVAPPGAAWLWTVRAAAAVALALAGYLLVLSLRGHRAGCGAGQGCESVLASRWSRWLGVPVAAPAVLVYGSILLATLRLRQPRRAAWALLAAAATVAAGAAAWFAVLQVRAIEALCPYCLATHACGLLIGALVAAQAVTGSRAHAPPRLLPACLAGLAVLAALVAGQVLAPHPAGADAAAGDHRFLATQLGTHSATQPSSAPSTVSLLNGTVRLDAGEFPLLGDPSAPHRLAVLADYTCADCRSMHATLARAHHRYGGRFSVLLLPMPLDARCNGHVRSTLPRHQGACDLARLALAVWRADPSRFADMDAWLFTPATPPTTAAARQYASALVGEEALRRAEADPWVQRAIQAGVRIHNTSSGDQVPKLLLPTTLVVGRVEDESQLFALLEEEFRIRPARP